MKSTDEGYLSDHAAAYGRLGGGTAEKVHNNKVNVPRPSCCKLERSPWFCPIRGGKSKLFYEIYGHGPEKVMMVMGLAAVHIQWEPQIQYFGIDRAAQYTLCVFDGRGLGFSDDCGGRWRTSDLASDVLVLVDHLGSEWRGGCHLVGFSLGGMIGLEALLTRPAFFDSLALISSHAGGLFTAIPPLRGWRPFTKTFACLGAGRALDAGLELLYPKQWLDTPSLLKPLDATAPATIRYERARALILRARKYVESGYYPEIRLPGVLRQIGAVVTHCVSEKRLEHIKSFKLPVLCVCGHLDNLIDPTNSAYMARKLGATLLSFRDAGHGCHEQKKHQVNEALHKHFGRSRRTNKTYRQPMLPGRRMQFSMLLILVSLVVLVHYYYDREGILPHKTRINTEF